MKTYTEKLKHHLWIERSDYLKAQAGWVCHDCRHSFTNDQLAAHHCWYEFGRDPWDYPDDCFLVLCHACHFKRQKVQDSIGIVLGSLTRLLTVEEIKLLTFELVAHRTALEQKVEIEL